MSNVLTGVDAKAYILPSGARATWGNLDATSGVHKGAAPASLAEIDVIKDAKITAKEGEGDASMRRSKHKLYVPTLTDTGVDLQIPWYPTDPQFILLRNAKLLRKTVAVAFLDQAKDIVGAQGLWADWHVFDFSPDQTLDGVQVATVTLKPAPSAVAPEWVEVTAGSST